MEYEDRLTITTPEGVDLELALAGLGSRFIAALADLALRILVGGALAVLLILILDGGVLILFLSVGGFLMLFAYDVAFETLNAGRTPGKQWSGLRTVKDDGSPVTFVTSAIRNVLRLVDFLPSLYGVGAIVLFATRRNQRLGDLAAGTIVVRERHGGRKQEPARVAVAEDAPLPSGRATAGWDTSAVTAEDLATARAFLERRADLTPEARSQLGREIADRLAAKVAGAPRLAPEQFLEQLVSGRDR